MRHDVRQAVFAYTDAAGLRDAHKDTPLFQSIVRREKKLSDANIHTGHLPDDEAAQRCGPALALSPHSFRVTSFTDLPAQGVALENVQLLGWARRPAHHMPLRSAPSQDHKEYSRKDLNL